MQKATMLQRMAIHWSAERILWAVLALAVLGIAVVPLAYVFDAAFHEETRFGLANKRGFEAIISVYTTWSYLGPLVSTLILAAVVTIIGVTIGVIMAVLISRTDLPRKALFDILIIMPLFMSPFAGLLAWMALASEKSGFINGFFQWLLRPLLAEPGAIVDIWSYSGIVWVMVLFFSPFSYLFTIGNLRGMDSSLEEAARINGASPMKTLIKITLPMATPAIMASALLVFILACEIYTIPGVVGTTIGYTTLPWKIYRDFSGTPVHFAHAAAASTVLLWITCLGIWWQRRLTRQTERFTTVTGKGFRARPLPLGRWKMPAIIFVTLYIFIADILPFGALIVSSLMKYSAATLSADNFTLGNYMQFFMLPDMVRALANTAILAVVTSMVCVALGVVISYMEIRRPSLSTKFLAFLGVLPVAVPGIVYGIGLMWTFLRSPLYGTIWVLLLAHAAKFIPYSIVVSRAGVLQIHPDLEQSARMCGANGLRSLGAVTLPLLKPTLIGILFFVMLMSIKEMSASVLLASPRSTVLSVLTWNYVDSGNYQFAAAIGVIQSAIMLALIFVTRKIFKVQLEKSFAKTT